MLLQATTLNSYRIYSINHPGRLLNFLTSRVSTYLRLGNIKFLPFSANVVCLLCNKAINGNNKMQRCNKVRFL